MKRFVSVALALVVVAAVGCTSAMAQRSSPPANYKKVSTLIPVKDITAHKAFDNLGVAKEKVDHVDMYYNAGHPGVAEPHYHIVIWYVSPQQAATLK
jgi:hypothetical protein